MSYFSQDFVDFFATLSRRNKREWFHANKKQYERAVKEPFAEFVGEIIHRVSSLDPAIAIEPKEAIFRIARDTRFTKDKTPYKTFAAAVISPGGRRDLQYPGLYFQFGATGALIAGGLYQLERDGVLAVRRAIVQDGERLDRALRARRFRKYFGELHGDRLKRLPQEFAPAAERFPYVANKQFYYYAAYEDPTLVLRKDLATFVMRHHEAGGEVNAFLKAAIGKG